MDGMKSMRLHGAPGTDVVEPTRFAWRGAPSMSTTAYLDLPHLGPRSFGPGAYPAWVLEEQTYQNTWSRSEEERVPRETDEAGGVSGAADGAITADRGGRMEDLWMR